MTDSTTPRPTPGDAGVPDAIVPDTKDWTWVLRERCPECGFAAAQVEVPDVGAAVRDSLPRWRAVLARPDARERPEPGVWSPLEYGAHVRDVFRIFDERLGLMLSQDDPLFANWDQDVAAIEGGYASQDPARLAHELEESGAVVADRFDGVDPADVGRVGRRSDGSQFTVRTLGQYFLHDIVHHLYDVRA
ncbi:DinB family protein [Isoptericola sp. NEAU-Y5]|uniref:DinB family protein n=1 Tax=Isoptericola luteus TaxID=2879484 RepID=A0ABS7ZAC2_9MICO|nr:DinB family protein [Isoptericola sp. NEAU-Y5]MCA5892006.1 DinB family protein [Isoptericola sp. NEAU-Y5]